MVFALEFTLEAVTGDELHGVFGRCWANFYLHVAVQFDLVIAIGLEAEIVHVWLLVFVHPEKGKFRRF